MRKSTCLTVMAILLALSGCTGLPSPFKAETRIEQTLPHVAGSGVRAESTNGSIILKVSEQAVSEVTVIARFQAGGRTQEQADKRLQDAKIHLDRLEDQTLHVFAEWPEPRFGNDSCHFEIIVPEADGVVARTSNGAVSIAGATGLADLRTSNGAITLTNHEGDAVIATSNGRIICSQVAGRCEAETSNGAIELRGVRGEVVASTTNGAVTLEMPPGAGESFRITTSNGAIRAQVSPEWAGSIEARTSNGSLSCSGADQVDHHGKNHLTARVGEGGNAVGTLHTSNGRITVQVGG